MITFELDAEKKVLILQPHGPLSEADFKKVGEAVDPLILQSGELTGVIIRAESFPGWDSFAALLKHLDFIRDHHHHVKRVAVVSDALVLTVFPQIADTFIASEVRHFDYHDYDDAVEWIESEVEELVS